MNSHSHSALSALLGAGIIAIILPGCAGYNSQPLRPLASTASIYDKKERVSISYQAFSKNESLQYLGKDVLKAGYQPIQITIYNNTQRNLLFSPTHISLPTVSADIVAKSVYDSSTQRAVGWGITGLFIPIFLIPAIVDTSWSVDANQEMEIDYKTKATKEQLISAGSSLNGVIFVPADAYKKPFTVTLTDVGTDEKLECIIS